MNRTNLPPAKSAEEYERLLRAAAERLAQAENQVDFLLGQLDGSDRWTAEDAMAEIRKRAAKKP